MALVKDDAYWRHVREVAAKAPTPPDAALDMLRRLGFPTRARDEDRKSA